MSDNRKILAKNFAAAALPFSARRRKTYFRRNEFRALEVAIRNERQMG
jgi:hypothetical protein